MGYPSSGHLPKPGDIILRRMNGASTRYTLGTSGGAAQIACTTLQEAIAGADRFARSQHVDVWQTDDGRVFTRIIEWRQVSTV
jgi:hypothetical protein